VMVPRSAGRQDARSEEGDVLPAFYAEPSKKSPGEEEEEEEEDYSSVTLGRYENAVGRCVDTQDANAMDVGSESFRGHFFSQAALKALDDKTKLEDVIDNASHSKKATKSRRQRKRNLTAVRQLEEDFRVLEDVGKGKYGKVYKVACRRTGTYFACKTLQKTAMNPGFYREEAVLMRRVCSSGVSRLEAVYETIDQMHIVTDYYPGGELYDFILEHAPLSETSAAGIVSQILCSLRDCHRSGVIHLDVKPENFVLRTPAANAREVNLVLIDFGHAKTMLNSSHGEGGKRKMCKLSRRVGSVLYAAPEVVQHRRFGITSDAWSVGVMAYILLTGQAPWDSDREDMQDDVADSTRRSKDFASSSESCATAKVDVCDEWERASNEARDFVMRLLRLDASKRMSISEALRHKWLRRASE